MSPRSDRLFAYGLATVGPVAFGAALIPLRDDISNAAIAVTMVLWVLASALLGARGPAMVAAVSSTLAFVFLHTEPYQRPTMDRVEDVEVAVVYLVVGLLVGEIASQALASRGRARWRGYELARIYRVAQQVAAGASPEDVIQLVTSEVADELGLVACRFEPGEREPLDVLVDREGALVVNGERRDGRLVSLPRGPMELPVASDGRVHGRLVLEPGEISRVPSERLVITVTLGDLLAIALR